MDMKVRQRMIDFTLTTCGDDVTPQQAAIAYDAAYEAVNKAFKQLGGDMKAINDPVIQTLAHGMMLKMVASNAEMALRMTALEALLGVPVGRG